jgi:hypothetical protein
MGHFSVEIMRLPGQLSVEINTERRACPPTVHRLLDFVADQEFRRRRDETHPRQGAQQAPEIARFTLKPPNRTHCVPPFLEPTRSEFLEPFIGKRRSGYLHEAAMSRLDQALGDL